MKSGIVVGICIAIIVSAIIIYQENTRSSLISDNMTPVPSPITGKCHIINGTLPDPNCTPGAVDPRVTQENINSTICVSGYTKTVRPPSYVTNKMKLQSMKEYGFMDSPSNYEYDHLISLELGGAPQDTKNLWPEPHSSSYTKDAIENYLHKQVCSGDMKLEEAQKEIATNWYSYWMRVKN